MPLPCAANELRHLKVSDIDSQRMILHVREGKGGVPRDIALSPALLERLRIYYRWRKPKDWLFLSPRCHNHPLDDGPIRKLCDKAGGEPASSISSIPTCSATLALQSTLHRP
jgi:integrase